MDILKKQIRSEELRQAWQIFADIAGLGAELCALRPESAQGRYFTMTAPDNQSLKITFMSGAERKRAQTAWPEQALNASLVDLPDYEFEAFRNTLGITLKTDTYRENKERVREFGLFDQVTFTDMRKAGKNPFRQCRLWACAVSGNYIPRIG
jgi:hypothetical protein